MKPGSDKLLAQSRARRCGRPGRARGRLPRCGGGARLLRHAQRRQGRPQRARPPLAHPRPHRRGERRAAERLAHGRHRPPPYRRGRRDLRRSRATGRARVDLPRYHARAARGQTGGRRAVGAAAGRVGKTISTIYTPLPRPGGDGAPPSSGVLATARGSSVRSAGTREETMRLQGRTAVVTGARARPRRGDRAALCREGAAVMINDMDPETARRTVERITGQSGARGGADRQRDRRGGGARADGGRR